MIYENKYLQLQPFLQKLIFSINGNITGSESGRYGRFRKFKIFINNFFKTFMRGVKTGSDYTLIKYNRVSIKVTYNDC